MNVVISLKTPSQINERRKPSGSFPIHRKGAKIAKKTRAKKIVKTILSTILISI